MWSGLWAGGAETGYEVEVAVVVGWCYWPHYDRGIIKNISCCFNMPV